MTWQQWLTSEGRVIFQLIMLWVLVMGLIGIGLYLHWQTKQLMLKLAQERASAIEEVRKAADELAERTAQIAAELKADNTANVHKSNTDLDAKISDLLRRFDSVGRKQDEVKAVLHRELETGHVQTEKTTRQQIDEIQTATDDLRNRIDGEKA